MALFSDDYWPSDGPNAEDWCRKQQNHIDSNDDCWLGEGGKIFITLG